MRLSSKQWYEIERLRAHVMYVLHAHMPYCILSVLFLWNFFIMWPGHMSPDSYTQYKAAIHGIFDDHHPPMMSLVWRLLDLIYKGPGLLFLMHLTMLYGSCLFFMRSSRIKSIQIFYSLFPLIPHVLFYSAMIWKDVGFAFSFLLAIAILHFHITQQKHMNMLSIGTIVILIFYGSAIKFQGQYVAPIIIFGIWYCLDSYRIFFSTLVKTVLCSGLFLSSLQSFNDFFVPPIRKAHSWQCVKIYDLAAMSLYAQQPLFPTFLKKHPDFSIATIQKRFNHKRVDDLFMPPNNPLRLGRNEEERAQLLTYWQQTVWHHMPLYLHHRFMNWWTMVTNMPLQQFDTMDFTQFGSLHWFIALQKAAAHKKVSTVWSSCMHYAGRFVQNFLYAIRYCFKFVFLLPFMLFYLIFGLIYFKRYGQGMSLLLMNGLSLWFLGVLFFCSMASDMRYAYIAACMTHASHGIAWGLWRKSAIKIT